MSPPTLAAEAAPLETPTSPRPERPFPTLAVSAWVIGPRELDLDPPSPGRLTVASIGFAVAFGAVALSLPPEAMGGVAVAGLGTALGTALLTGPALLILHQFLGLNARPVDVLGAASKGFADAGAICLGLTPFLLLLSLTSRLAPAAIVLGAAGIGVLALAQTHRRLMQLEVRHPHSQLRHQVLAFALATGWSTLALLVAARVAVALLFPALLS